MWGFGPDANMPPPNIAPYFASSPHTPEEVLKVHAEQRPDGDELDLLVDVQGDQTFGIPGIRLAEAASGQNPSVWLYRFSLATPVLDGALGACHTLEPRRPGIAVPRPPADRVRGFERFVPRSHLPTRRASTSSAC